MATLRLPVDLTWDGPGSPGVNVWHMRSDSVPGTANQSMVDAIHDFYEAIFSATDGANGYMTKGLRANLGEAVDVESSEATSFDWDEVVAAASTTDLPEATQVVVGWRTSIAARRGHGRTFIGPLSLSTSTVDGAPKDPFMTVVRNAAADLVSYSAGNTGASIGVYGLQTAGGSTHVLRDITGYKVRQSFAVLRSRRD